jgi:CRP-like cAMP-binding protein
MAANATSFELHTGVADALEYLPVSGATEYGKGETIYGPTERPNRIYLVVVGTVEISQLAGAGSEVLLDLIRAEELFGESAFLDIPLGSERAVAIEKTKLMSWDVSEMEDLVMKQPRLGVALMQILAWRTGEFTRRIESFALDSIEQRLARSLIRFSERLGTEEENGIVSMMPLTHAMLSRYVGTSREIVTQYMIRFRKRGHVSYSRQGIRLRRDALRAAFD